MIPFASPSFAAAAVVSAAFVSAAAAVVSAAAVVADPPEELLHATRFVATAPTATSATTFFSFLIFPPFKNLLLFSSRKTFSPAHYIQIPICT